MADQVSLFEYAASRGASRADGPQTSRDAGRSIAGTILRDQQAMVLHCLAVFCRHGEDMTAYEAWDFLTGHGNRIKENVASKRLGELVDMGMARLSGATRPGSSHRQQKAYAITDHGQAWIADRLRSPW